MGVSLDSIQRTEARGGSKRRQARYYPAIHPYGAGADLRSNPQDATELLKDGRLKGVKIGGKWKYQRSAKKVYNGES